MLEHATLMELDNVGNQFKSTAELVVNKGIKQKNIDTVKYLEYCHQNDIYPIEVIRNYGAVKDDGVSSKEHLITGTKYYFSYNGDDNNDGLTPATAKRTWLAAQNILSGAAPGTGILFKRGDVWDTSYNEFIYKNLYINGTETDPIVITCYGEGPLPKFNGLSNFSYTWTDEGDGTWSTTPMPSATAPIYNIKINGQYELSSPSLELLPTDNLGKWYHDRANGKLYTNINPNEIHSFEHGKEQYFFITGHDSHNFDLSYLEMEDFRRTPIIFGYGCNNFIISNTTVGKNCYRGMDLPHGSDFKIHNNTLVGFAKGTRFTSEYSSYYNNGAFEGINTSCTSASNNIKIFSNTIKGFKHGSIMVNGEIDDRVTGVRVYKNLCDMSDSLKYGGRIAFQTGTDNNYMYDNFMYMTTTSQFTGNDNIVENNIFFKARESNRDIYLTSQGLQFNIAKEANNNLFNNNIFFRCDGGGVRYSENSKGTMDNNQFISNIFYGCGKDGYRYPTDFVKGCQFGMDKQGLAYTHTNTKILNNVFYSDLTNKVIAYGATESLDVIDAYHTVEEFEALMFTDGTVAAGNSYLDINKI